jgi:cytochrome P450
MFAGAIAHPDWPSRARAQLDAVCGSNAERLPTFADVKQLPYIQAVVKESLRWRPLVDAGMNHMSTEDFEFEQYYFPKGTLFTWNAWAISQNPDEYEDPERFWPERFLNQHVDNVLYGIWGFGVGRRVCSGYPIASRNLFITIARLLYCFDIEYDGVISFVAMLTSGWQVRCRRTNQFFFSCHGGTVPFEDKAEESSACRVD